MPLRDAGIPNAIGISSRSVTLVALNPPGGGPSAFRKSPDGLGLIEATSN
jgi:hypothetical protein